MAVGGKPPSNIFVKANFYFNLGMRVPADYIEKVMNFYNNAIAVTENIPRSNSKTVKMTASAVLVLNYQFFAQLEGLKHL